MVSVKRVFGLALIVRLLLLTTAFLFGSTIMASAQVCGYYYSKNITINGSRITGGPHANFPVLISHTDPALTTASAKVTNTNGYDIVFADNAGNALDFQLERYDGATGQIVAWVKIPSITSGTNVTIQIRYGNAAITTNQSTTATWSSGYHGVWHFNNTVADASANNVTSTNNGSTHLAASKIGEGRTFNNNWVELSTFPNLTTSYTITGWVYSTNVAQDGQRIFVDDVNNTGGYGFSIADEATPGRLRFYSRGSNPVSLDANAFTLVNNTWYHVAAVADIAGNIKRIYVNGVERVNGTFTNAWGTDAGNASIGGETAAGETGNRLQGRLDEVRVASRVLSPQWLATEYNSQNQPTTTVGVVTAGDFYTVSATETFFGNPAQFGSNTWNVYAYNGNNFESYYGSYVHNTLSFDSRTVWNLLQSPSSAPGYSGCTVPNDNHSYRYKRQGFPCGYYQLDIPNHDDNVVLYVNGVNVFQQDSWFNNTAKTNQWQGYLGPTSTIEYTIREFGGDSHAGLTFNYLYGPQNSATQSVWNGSTSNAWTTAGNWCGSVPTNLIGAYIPSNGTTNSPNISAAGAQVLDLTIGTSATLSMAAAGTLASYGDWTNNGTFTATGGSTVTISGSNAITLGGTQTTTFSNLTMNNSNANALTLQGDITVAGILTLTSGDIVTGSNMVIMNDGGTVAGVSNNSYVSGLFRKIGNDAFTFPVGKAGYYAPISITAPSNTAHYYTAEYFNAHPSAVGSTSSLSGVDHVSSMEYWTLSKSAGASNERVTLTWDTPRSGIVNNTGQIRIAGWNGSQWASVGAVTNTGSTTAGQSVTNNNINVSTYTAFTLASSTTNNPLPVDLVSFTASQQDDHILLSWKTSTEKNNDYFTVKKSLDGKEWRTVAQVKGSGTTQLPVSYNAKDPDPRPGLQYYLLTQTDLDGRSESFPVIALNIQKLSEGPQLTLYPNPTDDEITLRMSVPISDVYHIQITDVTGKVYRDQVIDQTHPVISTKDLPPGLYFVNVIDGLRFQRTKFVRK